MTLPEHLPTKTFGGKPHVYPMRLYGDPVLRKKAKPVRLDNMYTVGGFESQSIREVANTMLETMFEQHGVGLAAPQIGLPIRLFVAVEYDDDEEANEGKPQKPLKSRVLREYVMINPVLKPLNRKKDKAFQEGCLSIPGIYEEGVARSKQVSINYTDLSGDQKTLEAEDYLARVFQHEIDHLDGVMFLDRLPVEVVRERRQALLKIQQASKDFLSSLAAWEKERSAQ